MGVAILTRDADLGASAALLANDVVAFDQRGCLSPRIALVEGGDARASVLGDALDVALTALGRQVPRGRLDDDERASAARYVEALAFAGRVFRGDDHVVGLAPEGAPLVVPPAGRHVHIASFADLDALERALAPFARFIVAVGTNDAPRVAGVVPAHARLSPLGAMQRPPFDGPVDRRVALVTAA